MKIFLSHSDEQKQVAEQMAIALRNAGHTVFFDKDDLPPGSDYNARLYRAIKRSDVFIYFISPESVVEGSYARTEFLIAQKRFRKTVNHLLSVMLVPTPYDQVPSYARLFTILEPTGNVIAEVVQAVADLQAGLAGEKLTALLHTLRLKLRGIKPQEDEYVDNERNLDTVQFTAYYPRETKVDTRYSLLLYAHTEETFENIEKDIKKFKEELGNKVPTPKTARRATQLRQNTPITVVPECGQIEFDPPSLIKKWGGEWTRFGLDFRPTQALSGDTLFIRVSVQVATVEVAHINCAVEVVDAKTVSTQHIAEAENPLAKANLNSKISHLYHTIFISYSRNDKEVVKVYKLVQEAVGNVAFMDTYSIHAGEDWRSDLALAIDQADIFQLFRSDNSAVSPNVRDEWEYALKHKCPDNRCVGFIRPVCWIDPIKPPPPEELGHLNFKYVPLSDLVTS